MRNRTLLSVVAATVLLVGSQASGNVTGTYTDISFNHPSCVAPSTEVCSGQGTNTFTWGIPLNAGGNPSHLTFTPVSPPFDAALGVFTTVAHLNFFNGDTVLGTEVSSVGLTFRSGNIMATGADSPDFDNFFDDYLFSLTFSITTTPNTGTVEQNRDSVVVTESLVTVPGQAPQNFTFQFNPNLFEVNENVDLPVEVQAKFGSIVLRFGEVADTRLGAVSFLPVPVPEPSTVLLFGIGLMALVLTRRGRSGVHRQR